MPSTYTTNLGIEKIGTGEQSGTWGTTTNTNFDLIDQGVNGIVQVTLAAVGSTGSPNALTVDNGAVSDGRNKFIEFVDGGDLGGTAYVQLQPNDAEKVAFIRNSLSGSRSIIIFQGTYNASNDFEIPNGADVVLKFDGAGASATVTQVFENLTVSSATLASGVTVNAILDEDNMASDSDTALATQQSIKAYVDSQVTAQDLDIAGDTGTGAVDLDSQSLTIAGTANEIETSASGQTITVGLPNAVTIADLTATTADINGGTIDGTVIGGSSAAAGSFTTITASGEITANGGIALGDNQKATFGASDDLQIYHDGSNSIINDNGVGSLILRATNFRLFNADQTKVSILANDGSNTSLYYDGSPKLATTATGIDVTGTVTADGLTVDGAGTITNTSAGVATALSLKNNTAGANNRTAIDLFSASTKYVTLEGGYGASAPTFNLKVGNPPKLAMSADGNGDISFYEDTGTTAKLTWDASAETLNFADNGKAIFGAGSDLQIYHDGSNSYISEVGAGDLILLSNGSTINFQATPGAEYMARFYKNAQVELYYDNAKKLATTATGIDVTGTVTLGSGNLIDWSTASSSSSIKGYGSYAQAVQIELDKSDFYPQASFFKVTYGSSDKNLLQVDNSGDISFYEDTGTTPKFFWDASAESLGIGTTSPSEKLEIFGNAILTTGYKIYGNANTGLTSSYLSLYNAVDGGIDLMANYTTSKITFGTAGSERARIDSSGNLLVGTTSLPTDDNTSIRFGVSSLGEVRAAVNNGNAAMFKRATTDGDIVEFRKDAALVGSIGTVSGDIYFGQGATNLVMNDGGNQILPAGTNGANRDAAITLGAAGVRFKDLYLSGGITCGLTSSQIVFQSKVGITPTAIISQYTSSMSIGYGTTTGINIASTSVVPVTGSGLGSSKDNQVSLGSAAARWSVVYAATALINTSDEREKTPLEDLDAAELAVAKELKAAIKKFKFKDAVEAKGEAARLHVGVGAQTVKAIFESHGLVAEDYAILCYDEWDAEFDEDGNETRPAGNRYGVRYEELLAFIIAAI